MKSFIASVTPEIKQLFNDYSGSVRAEIIEAISSITNEITIVSFNGKNSNINYKENKVAYVSLPSGLVMTMVRLGSRSADSAMLNVFLKAVKSIFQMGEHASYLDIKLYMTNILKLRSSIVSIDENNKDPLPMSVNSFGKYPYFKDRNNKNIHKNDGRLIVFIYPADVNKIKESVDQYVAEEYMTTEANNFIRPSTEKNTDPLISYYGDNIYSNDKFDDPLILQLLFNLGARRLYNIDMMTNSIEFNTWKNTVKNRASICTVIPPTSVPEYPGVVALRKKAVANATSYDKESINRPVMVAEVYPADEFFNTVINLDDGKTMTLRNYLLNFATVTYVKQGNVIINYDGFTVERSNTNAADGFGHLLFNKYSGTSYSKNDFGIAATIDLQDKVIVLHCLNMPVKYEDIIANDYCDYYYKFAENCSKFSTKISEHIQKYGRQVFNINGKRNNPSPQKANKAVAWQSLLHQTFEEIPSTTKPTPTPEQIKQESDGVDAIYSPEYSISTEPLTSPEQLKQLLEKNNEPPVAPNTFKSDVKIHDLMSLITAYIGCEYSNTARSTNDANSVVDTIEALQGKGYISANIKLTDLSLHTVSQDYCVGRDHNSVFGDTGINVMRTTGFSFNNFMVLNQYAFLNSEVLFFIAPPEVESILESCYTEVHPMDDVAKYKSLHDSFKRMKLIKHADHYIAFEEMTGYSMFNLANTIAYKKMFDVDNRFSFYAIVSVRHIGMKLAIVG